MSDQQAARHATAMAAPLRRIVGASPPDPRLGGTWERLECGHPGDYMPYGQHALLDRKRRCQLCVTADATT